jgi:bleomycin hydrolase
MRRHALLLALVVGSLTVAPVPARSQSRPVVPAAEREAFFDAIHAPNWLGTDIAHTSIKRQSGGTCWSFATVAFLESEALRTNEALREALAAAKQELDLSEYYVVYWGYVGKAEEWASRRGENANFSDGGLSHDVTRIVAHHGIVPESDYVVPDDYGAMRRDLNAVLERHREAGDFDADGVVADVRAVLDRHLAPPPETITVEGRNMTPAEYVHDVLEIDPEAYWEITSYSDIPFFGRGELDVPDNWWDYDGYYNLPLDAYVRLANRALDAGYPVVVDTDWGDMGAAWNAAGIAVMHPDMLPGYLLGQDARDTDFAEGRTTDDHLVLAVDHRVVDGDDWYLIKNSHGVGSGRRGYVWMRGDFFAMRALAIMVHPDAIDPDTKARFSAGS